MRVNIPGYTELPDSVPWSAVNDFLLSIGIDVNHVPGISKICIGHSSIEVDLYAQTPGGDRYLDTKDRAAVHHLIIHIDHEE